MYPVCADRTRWYPHAGWYLGKWRDAYRRCDAGERLRLTWAGEEHDAVSIRREFRAALERRINSKAALQSGQAEPTSGKHDPQYQADLRADVHELRRLVQHRVLPPMYRWRTALVQRRYGPLLDRERSHPTRRWSVTGQEHTHAATHEGHRAHPS